MTEKCRICIAERRNRFNYKLQQLVAAYELGLFLIGGEAPFVPTISDLRKLFHLAKRFWHEIVLEFPDFVGGRNFVYVINDMIDTQLSKVKTA